MSFYATIQGCIKYRDKDAFDKARKLLVDGMWLNSEGMFVDECGNVIDNGTMELHANPATLTITIPYFCHRNLSRTLDDLTAGTAGRVCWTSTDGCFEGGYYTDGEHKWFNLTEWAKTEGESEAEIPNQENDFEAYCEWMFEIETDFHDNFGG